MRALSFTGSTEVGRLIAAQCAPTMKRLVMELGGHAPLIVFRRRRSIEGHRDRHRREVRDIRPGLPRRQPDLHRASRLRRFRRCVHRADKGADRCERAPRGAEIGPLMHERAVAKCEAHVADALAKGARLLCGGYRHPAGPLFFQPTVLADVPPNAAIMHEETFGPVRCAPALRYGGRGREERQRHRIRPRRLSRHAGWRTRFTHGRRARLRHGRREPGEDHRRPDPVRRVQAVRPRARGSRHGLEAFTDIQYVCLDRG